MFPSFSSLFAEKLNQRWHNLVRNLSSTTRDATDVSRTQQQKQQLQYKIGYKRLFDLTLPEGRCVGLQLLELPLGHPDELSPEAIQLRKPLTVLPPLQQKASRFSTTASTPALNDIMDENMSCNKTISHHWIYDELHYDEINYGLTKLRENSNNQRCFWLGRLALRTAMLDHLSDKSIADEDGNKDGSSEYFFIKSTSILKDSFGRPNVPNGYLASISHKDNIGVALVSTSMDNALHSNLNEFNDDQRRNRSKPTSIGVDIELRQSTRMNIARRVLTVKEINDLGHLDVSILVCFVSKFDFISLNP